MFGVSATSTQPTRRFLASASYCSLSVRFRLGRASVSGVHVCALRGVPQRVEVTIVPVEVVLQ